MIYGECIAPYLTSDFEGFTANVPLLSQIVGIERYEVAVDVGDVPAQPNTYVFRFWASDVAVLEAHEDVFILWSEEA